jgi:hypothetical protein
MAPNGIFRGPGETDSRVGLPLKYHMIVINSPALFDAYSLAIIPFPVMKSCVAIIIYIKERCQQNQGTQIVNKGNDLMLLLGELVPSPSSQRPIMITSFPIS